MPNISMIVNLGPHSIEVNDDNSVLIASHPSMSNPITECVQLSADEAYKLYVTLAGVYANEPQQAPKSEQLTNARVAWRAYCVLSGHLQRPWVDRMACTGCGTEHLVARLGDDGRCETCYRQAASKE
jgi:hypothetical protein